LTLTVVCLQQGWTPLNRACEEGHAGVVKLLLDAKAKINIAMKVWRGGIAQSASVCHCHSGCL
jgi:hypothetical protein